MRYQYVLEIYPSCKNNKISTNTHTIINNLYYNNCTYAGNRIHSFLNLANLGTNSVDNIGKVYLLKN